MIKDNKQRISTSSLISILIILLWVLWLLQGCSVSIDAPKITISYDLVPLNENIYVYTEKLHYDTVIIYNFKIKLEDETTEPRRLLSEQVEIIYNNDEIPKFIIDGTTSKTYLVLPENSVI